MRRRPGSSDDFSARNRGLAGARMGLLSRGSDAHQLGSFPGCCGRGLRVIRQLGCRPVPCGPSQRSQRDARAVASPSRARSAIGFALWWVGCEKLMAIARVRGDTVSLPLLRWAGGRWPGRDARAVARHCARGVRPDHRESDRSPRCARGGSAIAREECGLAHTFAVSSANGCEQETTRGIVTLCSSQISWFRGDS